MPGLTPPEFLRARPALLGAAVAVLTVALGADAQQAAVSTPSADAAAQAVVVSTVAAGELLGETLALRVMTGAPEERDLRAAIAALTGDAARLRTAGRRVDAARHLELAAWLARQTRQSSDTSLTARRSNESVRFLREALADYRTAGDTIRQSRVLHLLAVETEDLAVAWDALRLAPALGPPGRIATLLAAEHLARRNGRMADADSTLVLLCRVACPLLTDDVEPLEKALVGELTRGPRYVLGPLAKALVALWQATVLDAGQGRALAAWDYIATPESSVREAADSAVAAGRRSDAAAAYHALAYSRLPTTPVPVGAGRATAEAAADELRLLAHGDTVKRARALSLLAYAHARNGMVDSARREQAIAESLVVSAPAPLRAQLRRRSAIIAAMAGDTARAERLLAEGIALRGTDSVAAAFDRMRLAAELATKSAGPIALREIRAAAAVLLGRDPEIDAELLVIMANAHRSVGQPDSTEHYYLKAAASYAGRGRDDRAAATLAAAAENAFERGRFVRADSLLGAATSALRRWPRSADDARQRIINDRGLLLFAAGRFEAARATFAVIRSSPQGTVEQLEAERGYAMAALALARADSARAAAFATQWLSADGHYVTTSESPPRAARRPVSEGWRAAFLARAAMMRGDLGPADVLSREALTLLAGVDHDDIRGRAYAVRAALFHRLGRADSATYYVALAQGGGARADDSTNASVERSRGSCPGPAVNPQQLAALRRRPAGEALGCLRTLLATARANQDSLTLGQTLVAIGVHHFRRAQPSRPDLATAYFDSATRVFRGLTMSLRALPDWAVIQFAEQAAELQQQGALAWLAQSRRLGARAAALGALAVADRGRGQAFDILTGRGYGDLSISGQIVMDALGDSAPKLGEELVQPRFVYGTAPAILAYLHADDTLITWLRVPGSATELGPVHVVRHAISRDSLAALVTAARLALGVGADGARGLPQLELASARTRGVGVDGAGGDPTAAFAALKALLLPAQLAKEMPAGGDLVVVASGPLAAVPFAALPVDTTGTPLSSRYAVRYSPSLRAQDAFYDRVKKLPRAYAARAENDSIRAARRRWLSRAVVLGNPIMPTVTIGDGMRQQLAALPGAEAEADAIAGMLGVEPLIGERATLAAVRARADSATVVHLATHGFAYGTEAKVGDSFVALTPERGDDGLLTVRELMEGKASRFSSAELVVLSACQTGLGQLTASEGTLGLQRAFLAAGASSVLVSLWSVSDEATGILLRDFYRHWLTDPDAPSKAESLRRAQEAVRADPRFAHPRYWAAFQLVGAP